MVTRSPCEYYTKYLISLPEHLTDDKIKDRLISKRLFHLSKEYIAQLRSEVVPPKDYMPRVRAHKASFNFLRKHKIASMYFPDADTKLALQVLDRPDAKDLLEANIILNMPPNLVVGQIDRMSGILLSVGAVEKYKHYFFNVGITGRTELRETLSYGIQRTAIDMPCTPAAALIAQMRMGMYPHGFDAYKLIKGTFELAALRTAESVMLSGGKSSLASLQYAQTTSILSNIIADMARPDEDVRTDLAMLKMKTLENKPPSIAALTGGNYSVDFESVDTNKEAQGNGDDGED